MGRWGWEGDVGGGGRCTFAAKTKQTKQQTKQHPGEGGPSALWMVHIQRQGNHNKTTQVPLQTNKEPNQNQRGRNRSS